MRILPRSIVAGTAGLAAAIVAGCGAGNSGTLLSTGQAQELTAQLTKISANLRGGNCQQAASELAQLRDQVANLDGINATLLSNLNQGVDTTASLASSECPTTTTTTQTTTSRTTTTSTTTSQMTTSTSSSQSTTTPDTGSGGNGISTITIPATPTQATPTTPGGPSSGGAGIGGAAPGPQGQVRHSRGVPYGTGFGGHHRHWRVVIGGAGGDEQ